MRSSHEKLALFKACFSGLTHVYGTCDPRTGRILQVKEPISDKVILDHLQGRRAYGVYLLTHDRTRAAAVDFDMEDTALPGRFRHRARECGLSTYLERSKRRGWHVWLFADQDGVSAAKVRRVLRAILVDIGAANTEVFPKQDRLIGNSSYGNFIFAPLFGARVREGRTVFVDSEREFAPYQDQWQLLASVERVTEHRLDEILRSMLSKEGQSISMTRPTFAVSERTYGLTPCVQRMLAEGVTEYQRVACFRIAVQLRREDKHYDVTVAELEAWAERNRPRDGRRIITREEIREQVNCAYAKTYRGCGCEEPAVASFCDASCPVRRITGHDPSRPIKLSLPA